MMDAPGGKACADQCCEHCGAPRASGAGIAGGIGAGDGRLTIVSGAAFAFSLLGMMAGAPRAVLLALQGIAVVSGGAGVARRAWTSIRYRRVDINVLMSVTVAGAIAIGEWTEAAAIAFLFTVSELLESRTVSRARRSIGALLDVAPREASLLKEGAWTRVPAQSLKPGDVILIRPGEKVAADGRVLNGRSAVDQSPITGESLPVDKARGDHVYTGSINREGALEVTVSRLPEDSTLARIIHLVRAAEGQKAPVQQFVDRFARYYTPLVIAAAAAVALVPPLAGAGSMRYWFYRGLALLAASCPCALVVSTPVSIVSAITNAARHGVLVKGGAHLETLGRIRAFAFDKTGTLTVGRLTVSRVAPFNGFSEDRVLSYAGGIESRSEHPVAQAILAEARGRGTGLKSTADFLSIPGMGASASVDGRTYYLGNAALLERAGINAAAARDLVDKAQAEGGTVTLLGIAPSGGEAGKLLGAIILSDKLRPQSAAVVSELRSIGIEHTVMITGDNRGAAVFTGDAAGVDEMEWELLPAEKVALIRQLAIRYRDVAMVGDGVNDAPALAAATVGIAMGAAGSDAALETADIALMADDLSRIPFMVRLGRRTLSVIRQNVVIALAIKMLSIGLIFTGITGLWMAVVADMGSSTLVTLNAMRLALGRVGR
ncbi:MAG: heavy metal translocating P-type ATPase [Ignavibacteriales bacterium]